MAEIVVEVLLPRTDAGVAAQVVVTVVVAALALWLVRRNRELAWFVAGVTFIWVAFMALRTVH